MTHFYHIQNAYARSIFVLAHMRLVERMLKNNESHMKLVRKKQAQNYEEKTIGVAKMQMTIAVDC